MTRQSTSKQPIRFQLTEVQETFLTGCFWILSNMQLAPPMIGPYTWLLWLLHPASHPCSMHYFSSYVYYQFKLQECAAANQILATPQ